MPLILGIETATEVCSVSLLIDNHTDHIESDIKYSHSEKLSSFIEKVFERNQTDIKQIDAVAVSSGPGSYTGLRIGVSVAKGICYSLNKPLIGINTLESMAYQYLNDHKVEKETLICPLIDARRMEVYMAVYNNQMNLITPSKAEIINEKTFNTYISNNKIILFGNGADKLKPILKDNKILFDNFKISSESLVNLGASKLKDKDFENVAYFEPIYIKEFIAIPPKNKIL